MSILAEPRTVAQEYRLVVGVDTHAGAHTYSVVEAHTGAVLDTQSFPSTQKGLGRATAWIGRRSADIPAEAVLISMEGTGSYGRLAAAHLANAGHRVVEALTPVRGKGRAKTDALDAQRAARDLLGEPVAKLRDYRAGDVAGALQVLTSARDRLARERTARVNALIGLLRTHQLGLDARRALTKTHLRTITGWRARNEPLDQRIARAEAIQLATGILELDHQLKHNNNTLRTLVTEHAPELLDEPGIGPVTAATMLTAWSYPGRVRNDAAFARLAGTAPIPTDSGNTSGHHRLDRGGDRRLNRALHIVILARMRSHHETRAYITKRTRDGKTRREIRRQLKRYLARHIYRLLTRTNALAPTA